MLHDRRVPAKASRALVVVFLGLMLILIRVWYLSVVLHEESLERANLPRRKTVIERRERGDIHDRFGVTLATRTLTYNALIVYSHIRDIATSTKQGAVRIPLRANYITSLSELLAHELHLEASMIEDLIHGRAALFPHTPIVIKENISEKEYARLRMLEKDWVGIHTERAYKRIYPQGRVGCDVLGYMGATSERQYAALASEIQKLERYSKERLNGEPSVIPKGFSTPQQVQSRLVHLQEKSLMLNEPVGKAGIEAYYDEMLSGTSGKKITEVDVKGNFIRELPGGRTRSPGKTLKTTLSKELQEYAESLLCSYELAKSNKVTPWIKGGAIVAMIPQTGEVVTMASGPRFDPNDFLLPSDPMRRKETLARIRRWLENETLIGEIWDAKRPLEKEVYANNRFYEIQETLSWQRYLDSVGSKNSQLRAMLEKVSTLSSAVTLLERVKQRLFLSKQSDLSRLLQTGPMDPLLDSIHSEKDKLLFLDVLHTVVFEEKFSHELLQASGHLSLEEHRNHQQEMSRIKAAVKRQAQEAFHANEFARYREESFKEYLKEKRAEEKASSLPAKPYIDYLASLEKKLFQSHWDLHGQALLLSHVMEQRGALKEFLLTLPEQLRGAYLACLRCFEELDRPLLGHYPFLRGAGGVQLEKHLASAFYPIGGFGYGKSWAYQQSCPLGSVFKLVTTYAALLEGITPFTLIDDVQPSRGADLKQIMGYTEAHQPIFRLHQGGVLPRSHVHIGSVDLNGAIEQSSNLYFSLLAAALSDPFSLYRAASDLGFGEKTGIDLPGEVAGSLPQDIRNNKSGLYAFAIGQHSLTVSPLQTAKMLACIATGGNVRAPHMLLETKTSLSPKPALLYAESFRLIGLDANILSSLHPAPQLQLPKNRTSDTQLPSEIRSTLIRAMRKVIHGSKGTARCSAIHFQEYNPTALATYQEISPTLIGKTGTAEFLYKPTLDAETKPEIRNHTWFGAISFTADNAPELVVVVLLRFGDAGKQAAPMAAQIVKKWREIQNKQSSSSAPLQEEFSVASPEESLPR